MSIPASNIVKVTPGVIAAGGAALALNGVILTADTSIPIGTVQSFPSADAVGSWFGPSSNEKAMADVYFAGRNNATVTPASLLFAQHNAAAVSGYLRSGSLASMTLTQLKALTGTLIITFAGAANTSASINLAAATSFSNAATLIQAAFTSPTFSVAYDPLRFAFVFTSTATGATATIIYATGTLATGLSLTQATGAVLSQGSALHTPTETMDLVVLATLNWGLFTTVFEPVVADKLLFSAWTNSKLNRFAYVAWDTSATAYSSPDTSSFMYQVGVAGYSGTVGVYNDYKHAAFVLGCAASIDFNRTNGRITFAFKYLSGLTASVNNETTAVNLETNGYNFIGEYATANDGFTFFYPGSVSGPYKFLDAYVNEIYLNSQLQLSLMLLLDQMNFIPYNDRGYTLIKAGCQDPIDQFINFGGIQQGVTLSAIQIAQVNNQAGVDIATTLSQRGWFLQVNDATAQVRAARGSPPCTFWYMDGGSVQRINLASIVVL
ncbi:MAG: DUF3383 domain-containing protein [Yersinia sp. (in: enterobacteria)]